VRQIPPPLGVEPCYQLLHRFPIPRTLKESEHWTGFDTRRFPLTGWGVHGTVFFCPPLRPHRWRGRTRTGAPGSRNLCTTCFDLSCTTDPPVTPDPSRHVRRQPRVVCLRENTPGEKFLEHVPTPRLKPRRSPRGDGDDDRECGPRAQPICMVLWPFRSGRPGGQATREGIH
jgi:hypothetical protein